MDSLTQAVLGASVAEAIAGKKVGRAASVLGAIVGTIPDLDIILSPFLDEFQRIAIHRGYSHSLIFCFLFSFFLAFIIKKLKWYNNLSLSRLYLLSVLCLITHVILDGFTTYGTQIFLPFTDWRVSFDSIAIIDPFYTLPMLSGLLLSLFLYSRDSRKRWLPNTTGLIISSLYLLFTLAHKHHIETVFYEQLDRQNLAYQKLLTVPVKIGNMEWYGVARNDSLLYLGKYSSLDRNKIKFDTFRINEHLFDPLDKELADRMRWFSKGFYTLAQRENKIRVYNMQCDMQGVRSYGHYKAPTAFYYEITLKPDGGYLLHSAMHKDEHE